MKIIQINKILHLIKKKKFFLIGLFCTLLTNLFLVIALNTFTDQSYYISSEKFKNAILLISTEIRIDLIDTPDIEKKIISELRYIESLLKALDILFYDFEKMQIKKTEAKIEYNVIFDEMEDNLLTVKKNYHSELLNEMQTIITNQRKELFFFFE